MEKRWIKDGKFWDKKAIILGENRIWNPTDEQLIQAGYEEYIAPEISEEQVIEEARRQKLQELDVYDKSSAVNSFTINDQEMWLSVEERQQLATQISANEAIGRTEMTKWFNGTSYTFPIESWKQMLVALEVYAGDALNITEFHKNYIRYQLSTYQEIQDYDFTQMYPEKLQF